jgi:fatty-acyl-CoA synthase
MLALKNVAACGYRGLTEQSILRTSVQGPAEENMEIGYAAAERAALNGKAREILDRSPDVGAFIRHGLSPRPEASALIYLRTARDPAPVVTSAGEFLGLMNATRQWLRRAGVGPDDVVALLAPNCTATAIVYWTAMSSATVLPINLLFSREAIVALVNAVGAKILFTPPPGAPGGLFEKVEGLKALAPTLKRIVALPLDGGVAFDGETILPIADGGNEAAPLPEKTAALLPTGGTTGTPKIVPLTHRNIVSSSIGAMLAAGIGPTDRFLIALPMFHVGGAFCTSLPTLGAGGTIVIPTASGFRNPEVVANHWRIIAEQGVTLGGGVPTMIAAAADAPLDGADLSRLRLCIVGGSICPPEIERRFLAIWQSDCLRQIYGMTEFAGSITQTPHDRAQEPASASVPTALAEVAVLAGGEMHLGPATPTGEILVRGPQMFSGYLGRPREAQPFYEGWLRSGDLGRIGAHGEVYITGRAKDLIIRGGHNIDPTGIEDVALRFPGVGLAAAVGRPDPYAGETPMLFVTPTPGANIDRADLADFLQAGVMEPPARPRAIEVIMDMPMTPVGKIFKPRLREIAAEAAALDALAVALPGAACNVAATHNERGLTLSVRVPASGVEAARAELGKLPVAFEIVAQ